MVCSFAAYAVAYAIWVIGSIKASERIHQLLVTSVLGTTLRYVVRLALPTSTHFTLHADGLTRPLSPESSQDAPKILHPVREPVYIFFV